MKKAITKVFKQKGVINQFTRKKLSTKMTSVILTLLFSMLTAASVRAYDWTGVNIDDLSMTGDGYFEAPISQNALELLRQGGVRINNEGFTLTSVDLIKSDGTPVNLSSGSNNTIAQSLFSDASEGDIIRCTYNNKQSNYNPKFQFPNGSDFSELNNRIYRDGLASNEVYIYNVETGKFMYIGGAWGTHVELLYSDFGLKFKMGKDGNRYVFTSDVATDGGNTTGGYLGMMQGYTGNNENANGIVVDKQKATLDGSRYCYSRFDIELVAGETNTYTLSLMPREYASNNYAGSGQYDQIPNTVFYLGVEDGQHVVTTDVNKAAKWRFVAVREIDEAVRNAALSVDAFNGMNLDVTYKIDNQGFNRNNEKSWTETDAEYIKYNKNDAQDVGKYKLLDPPTNGKYYYGLLKSASYGGTISRSFTAPATGWYKVECQGVSKLGNAVAYAKAKTGDEVTEFVTVPLNVDGNLDAYSTIIDDSHKQDRVNLGIDFYNNTYPVEVYVHAVEGQTVEFGIMQTSSYNQTAGNVQTETVAKPETDGGTVNGTCYTAGENQELLSSEKNGYIKMRTNYNKETITIKVKEGYVVTGISIEGYSNNTSTTADRSIYMTGVYVDGSTNNEISGNVVFPGGTAGQDPVSADVTGFEATDNIVLKFDNSNIVSQQEDSNGKNKQLYAKIVLTYKKVYDVDNDLTAFDDFRIIYYGDIFVLDEDYTACTDEDEGGNGYTIEHNGVTVLLHRTFSKDCWNTFTLPINMTGTQVKEAFGDNVQLAKASGLNENDPYIITFKIANVNDGIEAGQFYLIQPAKEPATPAGKTISIIDKNFTGPLYTLGRRNVPEISAGVFNSNEGPNGGGLWPHPNHNSIRYYGTYLKKVGGVPKYSYVFSKGNMYHTESDLTIKGFRFWIQDEDASSSAKPFTLSISGVEDLQENEQIATSMLEIQTVADDNADVYSLSGQFLGKGKQLLNSLPKGIYVVNNKKYMVK